MTHHVILTAGPQYAGKSTFCEKVVKHSPEIKLISRDKILMELFGNVYLNTYSNGHEYALGKMWEEVANVLQEKNVRLILDTWNGPRMDRMHILQKLNSLDVTRVDLWYFVTPLATCVDWSFKRDPLKVDTPRERKWREETYGDCYRTYHEQKLKSEKRFRKILKINPLVDSPLELLKTI